MRTEDDYYSICDMLELVSGRRDKWRAKAEHAEKQAAYWKQVATDRKRKLKQVRDEVRRLRKQVRNEAAIETRSRLALLVELEDLTLERLRLTSTLNALTGQGQCYSSSGDANTGQPTQGGEGDVSNQAHRGSHETDGLRPLQEVSVCSRCGKATWREAGALPDPHFCMGNPEPTTHRTGVLMIVIPIFLTIFWGFGMSRIHQGVGKPLAPLTRKGANRANFFITWTLVCVWVLYLA